MPYFRRKLYAPGKIKSFFLCVCVCADKTFRVVINQDNNIRHIYTRARARQKKTFSTSHVSVMAPIKYWISHAPNNTVYWCDGIQTLNGIQICIKRIATNLNENAHVCSTEKCKAQIHLQFDKMPFLWYVLSWSNFFCVSIPHPPFRARCNFGFFSSSSSKHFVYFDL